MSPILARLLGKLLAELIYIIQSIFKLLNVFRRIICTS